jgi:hypothetical protein
LPSRKAEATFEALRSHMTLGRSSEQKTSKLVIMILSRPRARIGTRQCDQETAITKKCREACIYQYQFYLHFSAGKLSLMAPKPT